MAGIVSLASPTRARHPVLVRSKPDDPAPPPLDSKRRTQVDTAREAWIRALIDRSRRNNLLYFRDLKTGTLDLTGANPAAMGRLLAGEEISLKRLLPEGVDLKSSEAKLLEIRDHALINTEERGIETMFMAMGMATWDPPDGERPAEAAILLVPLRVEALARGRHGLNMLRSGDVQANLVLLHFLETEFHVQLSADDLLSVLEGTEAGEEFDPRPVAARLTRAAREIPGFHTTDRIVVGNFAFQKAAMVRDLRECADQMAEHDLIAAFAGNAEAQRSVRERRVTGEPSELDRTPPEQEFLFLDADSSQQLVIRQAIDDQDGTIQGPPGTGKSQTIANLIAEFAARGLRVLFVSEKRAALEVVLERLRREDLEHLALDLHGAEISRRQVTERLQASLDLIGRIPPVHPEKTHSRLIERRKRLTEHVQKLHGPCTPTGRTLYDVQGRLLRLGAATLTQTRWRGKDLDRVDAGIFEKACDLLTEMKEHRALFLRCSDSPWNGAGLADGAAVRRAIALSDELANGWGSLKPALVAMCEKAGLRTPRSMDEVRELLAFLQDVSRTLDQYRPELFTELELIEFLTALAPASSPWLQRAWSFLASPRYRKALRTAKSHRKAQRASPPKLWEEVKRASEQNAHWRLLSESQSPPCPTPAFSDVSHAFESLCTKLKEMGEYLRRNDLEQLDLEALSSLLERLDADHGTPPVLPKIGDVERQLEQLGIQALVEELRRSCSPADRFVPMLEHAWLSSAVERQFESDLELAGFLGRSHDQIVEEFKELWPCPGSPDTLLS